MAHIVTILKWANALRMAAFETGGTTITMPIVFIFDNRFYGEFLMIIWHLFVCGFVCCVVQCTEDRNNWCYDVCNRIDTMSMYMYINTSSDSGHSGGSILQKRETERGNNSIGILLIDNNQRDWKTVPSKRTNEQARHGCVRSPVFPWAPKTNRYKHYC